MSDRERQQAIRDALVIGRDAGVMLDQAEPCIDDDEPCIINARLGPIYKDDGRNEPPVDVFSVPDPVELRIRLSRPRAKALLALLREW